jgi:peptidoglycan/LPS O-acetylase OafA/YrhL
MTHERRHQDAYLPALDGLRAVSILLVVVSHLGLGFIVPGGLGVTIFFFISGFIITRILLLEYAGSGAISLTGFYIKRVFRLAPGLIVYIFLSVLAFAMVGAPIPFLDVVASIFYAANYYIVFHGMGGNAVDSPLSILWSLAVEEHFYAAFPVLLLLMRKRIGNFIAILLTVCGVAVVWRAYLVVVLGILDVSSQRTYISTDTRIDSIVFGCLVSLYTFWVESRPLTSRYRAALAAMGSRPALLVATLMMVASLAYRSDEFRQTWRYSVQGVAMIPLFLHLFIFKRRDGIDAVLRSSPMVYIGKISYSLYLHHWLTLTFLWQLLQGTPQWQISLVAVPLMLGLAAASYHIVETPIRRIGQRFAENLAAVRSRSGTEAVEGQEANGSQFLADGERTGLPEAVAVTSDPSMNDRS